MFDLDGTLVDSAPGIATALSRLSSGRDGKPITAAQVRPLVSLGVETLVAKALGGVAGESDTDVAEFRTLLATVPADPAAIYPGVEDALARCDTLGFRMAIVTNKPERLSRELLEELHLSRHFGVIIGGDTVSRGKPDPMALHAALAALNGAATQAFYIGDSWVDAEAAAAAAIPFLLFEGGYGGQRCAPEQIAGRFADFTGLADMLAAMRGGPPSEAF